MRLTSSGPLPLPSPPSSYFTCVSACLSPAQNSQYDETSIPDILATIEEGQYSNIRPPLVLDVCSDPSKWPRPAGRDGQDEGGAERLWDAVICSNMIHISPQVRSATASRL